jgi:pimeloyl-ACP methyl ester carboxylesterase
LAIAIDPLGCGLSDKPENGDYSLSVLDELKIPRANLVGHSYGGAQMLALARAFPELCESLVLVTPAGVARNLGWVLRLMTIPWLGAMLSVSSRLASIMTMRMQIYDKRLVTREMIDVDLFYTSLPGAHKAAVKTLREGSNIHGQKKETYEANEPFKKFPKQNSDCLRR